jgi:hypothetical protein
MNNYDIFKIKGIEDIILEYKTDIDLVYQKQCELKNCKINNLKICTQTACITINIFQNKCNIIENNFVILDGTMEEFSKYFHILSLPEQLYLYGNLLIYILTEYNIHILDYNDSFNSFLLYNLLFNNLFQDVYISGDLYSIKYNQYFNPIMEINENKNNDYILDNILHNMKIYLSSAKTSPKILKFFFD